MDPLLDLFVLLPAASLRLQTVVKIFGHGTEIMKLCQGLVCPIALIESNVIKIM